MESSIAVFLMRQLAYEQLPTRWTTNARSECLCTDKHAGLLPEAGSSTLFGPIGCPSNLPIVDAASGRRNEPHIGPHQGCHELVAHLRRAGFYFSPPPPAASGQPSPRFNISLGKGSSKSHHSPLTRWPQHKSLMNFHASCAPPMSPAPPAAGMSFR